MISKYTYNKITWIDLETPTRDEVLSLVGEYNIPLLVVDDILEPTVRSKVDKYDNLIYLILHFPNLKHAKNRGVEQEIDFVIGKNFIITTHYETIDPLHEFSKIFETNSILNKSKNLGEHAGFLFFYLIRELYKYLHIELDDLNKYLLKIEKKIFEGKEGEVVEDISSTNRKLLDFKQSIRFHREILKSFESAGKDFFGGDFSYYLGAIIGEYNKVQNILDGHKEILNDLKDTNDSLLTNKTNETMKILTVMNFVMLPLALITGVFGMNSEIIFIKNISDFFIVLGAMVLTGIAMVIYFKKKKWI